MKPGDVVEIVQHEDPWFGSTGVIFSVVTTDGEETTYVRVTNISDHSLPHAIGVWDISSLKLVERT